MRRISIGLVLVLLLMAAGCGDPLADQLESSGKQPYSDEDVEDVEGADSDPTTTTAPLPDARQAFVAQGNRTCQERSMAFAGASRRASTPEELLQQLSRLVDAMRTNAALLEGMTPPPGDEAAVADLIGGLRHIISILEPVVAAGGYRSEQERADVMARLEADGTVVTARFDAYGLTRCF